MLPTKSKSLLCANPRARSWSSWIVGMTSICVPGDAACIKCLSSVEAHQTRSLSRAKRDSNFRYRSDALKVFLLPLIRYSRSSLWKWVSTGSKMIFVPGAERRMRASMASQTLGRLRIAAVKSLVLRRWRYSTMSPVSTPMFQRACSYSIPCGRLKGRKTTWVHCESVFKIMYMRKLPASRSGLGMRSSQTRMAGRFSFACVSDAGWTFWWLADKFDRRFNLVNAFAVATHCFKVSLMESERFSWRKVFTDGKRCDLMLWSLCDLPRDHTLPWSVHRPKATANRGRAPFVSRSDVIAASFDCM